MFCVHTSHQRSTPDWWNNNRYVNVAGYGRFDLDHVRRGWTSAQFFDDQTKLALARGGGVLAFPAKSGDDFIQYYSVSGSIPPGQMDGVLYGMYTDFEILYEQHQGTRWDRVSSFSPDDLPSDHLGFWAYVNGKEIDEIPFVLERLGEVSPSIPIPFGFPKNHEFLPMAPQKFDQRSGPFATYWQNVPWPSWLELVAIPSGPGTWQRVD